MIRVLVRPALALALAFSAAPAGAATYQGRSVDGHRYHGDIVNHDYGAYRNVEVRFQGEKAYIYFAAGGRLVLFLEDEEIQNPHSIPARDPRRGITWEIDVMNLHAR
jgi:hypothetical protein